MIKYADKEQLWGERAYFVLRFQTDSPSWWGRHSNRLGRHSYKNKMVDQTASTHRKIKQAVRPQSPSWWYTPSTKAQPPKSSITISNSATNWGSSVTTHAHGGHFSFKPHLFLLHNLSLSSLMRCLFRYFCLFPICLCLFSYFCFAYLILEFYIKDNFENLFSWPMTLSFTFLTVSVWDHTGNVRISRTWGPSLQTWSILFLFSFFFFPQDFLFPLGHRTGLLLLYLLSYLSLPGIWLDVARLKEAASHLFLALDKTVYCLERTTRNKSYA